LESLESKVNGYLHGNARARKVNEACGPFHIGFDANNTNPFLNYAVPESRASVTEQDIAALVSADKTVRSVRGRMAVAGLSPHAMELLRLTGLDRRLDVHRTTDAAAHALREP